jgi:hypothetical protein
MPEYQRDELRKKIAIELLRTNGQFGIEDQKIDLLKIFSFAGNIDRNTFVESMLEMQSLAKLLIVLLSSEEKTLASMGDSKLQKKL